MENNFSIEDIHKRGQGPYDHLRFTVGLTDLDFLRPHLPFAVHQRVFFSPQQAMMTLLQTDLQKIDPGVARFAGHSAFQKAAIHYGYAERKLAELVYIRPGYKTYGIAEPGIYLHSLLGIDGLQKLCGLPLLEMQGLQDNKLLKLASYGSSFEVIELQPVVASIRSHIHSIEERMRLAGSRMPYELVLKGENLDLPDRTQRNFMACHYYDNLYEPIKALVNIDPNLFDVFGAQTPKPNLYYHFGYVLQPGAHDPVASINVIPIADAPDGEPSAGVYLHFDPDMGAVCDDAQMDLSQAGFWDADMPHLQLAAYRYFDGTYLETEKGIAAIQKDFSRLQAEGRLAWHSPFNLSIHYEMVTPLNSEQPVATNVTDHYHHRHLSQAMLQLLDTEFPFFEKRNAVIGQFATILAASITDDQGKPWANIVSRKAATHDITTLFLELNQPPLAAAIEGGVILNLNDLSDVQLTDAESAAALIPLCHIHDDGRTTLHHRNLFSLQGQLSEQVKGKDKPVTKKISEALAGDRPPVDPVFSVRLIWFESGSRGGMTTEIVPLDALDLSAAYQYLKDMDVRLFSTTHPQHPYLMNATLIDGRSQQTIVIRYQVGEHHKQLSPGFYLLCNQSYQALDTLIHVSHEDELVELASSLRFLLYRQRQPPAGTRPPRQRVFAPWPHQKSPSKGH